MLMVNKVYVAHYTPLAERRSAMEGQLARNNISCEWLQSEPTLQDVSEMYEDSKEEWARKTNSVPYSHPVPYKALNRAEISLAYKHIKIYEDMLENDYLCCLILEDDAILCENFSNSFNLNLSKTPKDWDFIFIGSGCDLRIEKEKIVQGKTAYLKNHPASKCTDSYVIRLSAAKKILSSMKKISFPIDFELNYQMCLHDMNVYWWEPPLVRQGSQSGLYGSEIQTQK